MSIVSKEEIRPRLGEQIHFCPKHHIRLKLLRSGGMFTKYGCPIGGCDHTKYIKRPDPIILPSNGNSSPAS